MKVPITTTLEKDKFDEIKKYHLPYNLLIYMGLDKWKGMPDILRRQNELEAQVTKLQNANMRLQKIILEINEGKNE